MDCYLGVSLEYFGGLRNKSLGTKWVAIIYSNCYEGKPRTFHDLPPGFSSVPKEALPTSTFQGMPIKPYRMVS